MTKLLNKSAKLGNKFSRISEKLASEGFDAHEVAHDYRHGIEEPGQESYYESAKDAQREADHLDSRTDRYHVAADYLKTRSKRSEKAHEEYERMTKGK